MIIIHLDTPHDPGADDTTHYYQVAIHSYRVKPHLQKIIIRSHHGNTVGGAWAAGIAGPSRSDLLENIPASTQHWDVLMAKVSVAAGEAYLAELERELLQWLVDQAFYSGTVQ